MTPEAFAEARGVLLREADSRLRGVDGPGIVERTDLSSDNVRVLPGATANLLSDEPPKLAPALPTSRYACAVPPFPHILLITTLDAVHADQAELMPILWWIACVRAHISVRDRADLHALVLLDQNASHSPRWRSMLEGDDRFCRKLVWLVPPNPDDRQDSARAFLDRTFLAQPWSDEHEMGARGLDPLADLAESLAREVDFPESVVRQWLALLAKKDLVGRDLALELVRIAEGRNVE